MYFVKLLIYFVFSHTDVNYFPNDTPPSDIVPTDTLLNSCHVSVIAFEGSGGSRVRAKSSIPIVTIPLHPPATGDDACPQISYPTPPHTSHF